MENKIYSVISENYHKGEHSIATYVDFSVWLYILTIDFAAIKWSISLIKNVRIKYLNNY